MQESKEPMRSLPNLRRATAFIATLSMIVFVLDSPANAEWYKEGTVSGDPYFFNKSIKVTETASGQKLKKVEWFPKPPVLEPGSDNERGLDVKRGISKAAKESKWKTTEDDEGYAFAVNSDYPAVKIPIGMHSKRKIEDWRQAPILKNIWILQYSLTNYGANITAVEQNAAIIDTKKKTLLGKFRVRDWGINMGKYGKIVKLESPLVFYSNGTIKTKDPDKLRL